MACMESYHGVTEMTRRILDFMHLNYRLVYNKLISATLTIIWDLTFVNSECFN